MKHLFVALTFLSFTQLFSSQILEGTHAISTHLAYDRFSDARSEATKLLPVVQDWLEQATESHSGFHNIKKFQSGLTQMSHTSESAPLRLAFSIASEGIVGFLRSELELRKNWQLHFCPHVEGHYAFWVQPLSEGRMNPYFGKAMFSCGVKKSW